MKETIYRRDYRKPDFLIPKTELYLDIREDHVTVTSVLTLAFNGDGRPEETPLVLNGEDMEILMVELDGREVGDYDYRNSLLTLTGLKEKSRLVTRVRIDPYRNTRLMGLYRSGSILCTQCEAEGFRRITPFPDHPDILSRFTTTLEGTAPVLLSNGNLIKEERTDEGRRVVTWEDPFPKPCYLFAAVSGDLALRTDRFTTRSGREIELRIYTDHGNEARTGHAMDSLKQAMTWDEDTFGLEYDLDLFMIVAVDAFNFGAMENKGLNIFNSAAVLADREITTDEGLIRIAAIVAHEYFHNWTGNRVTCRDWFQLTLKEGLTVFRDASFTEDTTSPGVARIRQYVYMKQIQFPEDAGPNSHPIRPESYREIDNFYTPTVYRKGAQVIRMMRTFAGKEGFRQGMDEYFRRHDGQAVTCEDFLCAMEAGARIDLGQFRRWYNQAGTPRVEVSSRREGDNMILKVRQHTLPSADGSPKEPFCFPLGTALFNREGTLIGEDVLTVTREEEEFSFPVTGDKPVYSCLRDFSAPVILESDQTLEDHLFLLAHETDPFSRYRSIQVVFQRILTKELKSPGSAAKVEAALAEAVKVLLAAQERDDYFISLLLTPPSLDEVGDLMTYPDYTRAQEISSGLMGRLGRALEPVFLSLYEKLRRPVPFVINMKGVGTRALKGTLLHYLVKADTRHAALAREQYFQGDNMTDRAAALGTLCRLGGDAREEVLADYYDRWKDQFLPLTQWFSYQTSLGGDEAYEALLRLEKHEKFQGTNPNMIRALYGGFVQNRPQFHHPSGRGYRFLAKRIITLDGINPGLSAALAKTFLRYSLMGPELKGLMKEALEGILAKGDQLSPGLLEIVGNTLKE